MLLKLVFEQSLVLLVDIADHLQVLDVLINIPNFTTVDLTRIREPNSAVVIFSELAFHFKNFDIMHLLYVITHFEALLLAVPIVILALDQEDILTACSEVILNLLLRFRFRCIELNRDWKSETGPRLDTSLDVA